MADENTYKQHLRDKQERYFGNHERNFYIGSVIGSTSAWTYINFSGTNTGFGPANQVLSNRFIIANSGTSFIQWSWNSGTTVHGELYRNPDGLAMDGISASGVWVRSNAATQGFRIWAW